MNKELLDKIIDLMDEYQMELEQRKDGHFTQLKNHIREPWSASQVEDVIEGMIEDSLNDHCAFIKIMDMVQDLKN